MNVSKHNGVNVMIFIWKWSQIRVRVCCIKTAPKVQLTNVTSPLFHLATWAIKIQSGSFL